MTSVDSLIEKGFNFYDPSQNTGNLKIEPKKYYLGHICDTVVKEVAVKGKYKAKVYNFKVELAGGDRKYDCKDPETQDTKTLDANSFKGRKIRSQGVFQFLVPKNGDDFEANSGGNDRYLALCHAVGAKADEIQIEIDGEQRNVTTFPDLNAEDLNGKPIDCYLDIVKWKNQEGNFVSSINAKAFKSWEDGKARDYELEDIPF